VKRTIILCSSIFIFFCALFFAQARMETSGPETETAAPARAEFRVTMSKFKFAPRRLTVQKGQPVKITVTSADVDHGFGIRELKIKERVDAKQTKVINFKPEQTGRFRIYCSVYCGDGHDDMAGELVVTDAPVAAGAEAMDEGTEASSSTQDAEASNMKVTFDETAPGVVFVESNGEKIRIDTAAKTVAKLEAPAEAAPAPQEEEVAEAQESDKPKPEPYDYYLINVPTPKRVVKGSLNLHFTHRFAQPVRPFNRSGENLLGLDSFSASGLGLSYGITDRLYVNAYRTPLCQLGMCKTIEIGLGYHVLDEKGRSPIALSTYASIEGNDNFTEEFTYNLQAMISRSVTKYGHVFFSPAGHFNANGQRRFDPRAFNFFPPQVFADQFSQPKHTLSLGFGFSAHIRPSVSILFEYTPRFGFKQGRLIPIFARGTTRVIGFRNDTEAEIGFGIEKRLGRHSFALTFSNTQTTTTGHYNSSNLQLPPRKFTIGFNLYRRMLK
jgi:Heme/copper-type cytochrome/quinol oxidases, subunit 2